MCALSILGAGAAGCRCCVRLGASVQAPLLCAAALGAWVLVAHRVPLL